MKIVFFTPTFFSLNKTPGGMEKYIYNLIKKLRDYHEIVLFVPKEYNFYIKKVKIYRYYELPSPLQLISNLFSITLIYFLILLVEKPKILSVFLGNTSTLNLFFLSRLWGVKTVLNLRGAWEKVVSIDKIFEISFYLTDYIIQNARNLTEKYSKTFPLIHNRIRAIPTFYLPNGIDCSFWKPLPIDVNKKYDLCILANINNQFRVYEKGFRYLYEAALKIESMYHYACKILFIGDYDLAKIHKELGNFEQKYFTFVGLIKNKRQIKQLFAESKMFVLTSLSEGMSNALMESLSFGLPAIVTDVGAARELIVDKFNGFIIPPKNSDVLAEKIMILLQNDSLQREFSKNSQKRILENFSWDVIMNKINSCYGRIGK